MIKDLRQAMNLSGEMRVCYLAEDKAHITSPTFKVYIPDIMGGIDQNQTDYQVQSSQNIILNSEKAEFANPTNCQGYLVARSATPYGHRLDGYIQKFNVDNIEHPTGSSDTIDASSTNGQSDPVPNHPSHPITKALTLSGNSLSNTTFQNSIFTGSHGVDFQNIHNKVISRGHKMYGCFVVGEQNQFVIFAIDNAVPYLAGTEYRSDEDRPDTSFDNGANNPAN